MRKYTRTNSVKMFPRFTIKFLGIITKKRLKRVLCIAKIFLSFFLFLLTRCILCLLSFSKRFAKKLKYLPTYLDRNAAFFFTNDYTFCYIVN